MGKITVFATVLALNVVTSTNAGQLRNTEAPSVHFAVHAELPAQQSMTKQEKLDTGPTRRSQSPAAFPKVRLLQYRSPEGTESLWVLITVVILCVMMGFVVLMWRNNWSLNGVKDEAKHHVHSAASAVEKRTRDQKAWQSSFAQTESSRESRGSAPHFGLASPGNSQPNSALSVNYHQVSYQPMVGAPTANFGTSPSFGSSTYPPQRLRTAPCC